MSPFVLDCFAEHLLFKITEQNERRKKLAEKISRQMSKKQQNEVKQNKFSFDEVKKQQMSWHNSKNVHWLNKRLVLEWIQNHLKKSDQKLKILKSKSYCRMWTKNKIKRENFFKHRFLTLLWNWGVNIRRKPFAFSLHFLLRREQNHFSNLTSKIRKMSEQKCQKDSLQCNSNSLNCKKNSRRSSEIQKDVTEILKSTATHEQTNWTMPVKQKHGKNPSHPLTRGHAWKRISGH